MSKTIKKKFKIEGMHCSSCAMNIDGELEDTQGIRESNTNFAKSRTEVEFDPEKVTSDKIMTIIKSVGYKAEIME